MIIKIIAGKIVQTTSIKVPWTNFTGTGFEFELNKTIIRKINHMTKTQITIKKNIKSWWKVIIPSITGVAGSWNPSCQGELASMFEKLVKNLV